MPDTKYFEVNHEQPEEEIIEIAAQLILARELVAFPTETVYGLGAYAFSSPAVNKIFIAKQRPPENPLLVHVSNLEQVENLVTNIPAIARKLMDKFWPGPLSIILPARREVPEVVRGGKSSVGLRMPSHPVALALLNKTGPVAAPSANLSGHPSPVTADHVRADLDGRIAAVLDAGPTGGGVESTVLDLSNGVYRVLRRGGIGIEALQEVLQQDIEIADSKFHHFQTKVKILVSSNQNQFSSLIDEYLSSGRIGIVYYNISNTYNNNHIWRQYELDLKGQDSSLYTILRDAEQQNLKVLIFAPLPEDLEGIGASIADRIYRAAAEAQG
ncbi:MAG: L-threonylcarbamoyladenylate synthase [Syntrophomonas sp.]